MSATKPGSGTRLARFSPPPARDPLKAPADAAAQRRSQLRARDAGGRDSPSPRPATSAHASTRPRSRYRTRDLVGVRRAGRAGARRQAPLAVADDPRAARRRDAPRAI